MARYKISCCKDCPDRFPCCHSNCEEYIQQKTEYDETMAQKRKELNVKCGLDGFLFESIERLNKRDKYRSKYRGKR